MRLNKPHVISSLWCIIISICVSRRHPSPSAVHFVCSTSLHITFLTLMWNESESRKKKYRKKEIEMLPARAMEPVRYIALSMNVPSLYTLKAEQYKFLYRFSRNDTMPKMQTIKFLSDMMASSTWNFGESINNICLFMNFIHFLVERAAVRWRARYAEKRDILYFMYVWDSRHHIGTIGSDRFIIFGPYFCYFY